MFWDNPNRRIGQNAILFDDQPDTKPGERDEILDAARDVFQRVDKQPSLKIIPPPSRKPVRVVQVYRCYGFKGYDPARWQNGY